MGIGECTGPSAVSLAPPELARPGTVRIARHGTYWAITSRCCCGCGEVTRALNAATLVAAVWRFRLARRESWIVTAATQDAT